MSYRIVSQNSKGAVVKDILDTYSRRARLLPALITIFPIPVLAFCLFPQLYKSVLVALAGLAASFGMTFLMALIARSTGRAAEKRLFTAWGAAPTTQWLRHRDSNLDGITKARYHAFLAAHVPQLGPMPSDAEELANPNAADDKYRAGTKWLIEHTRDRKKFPLVFDELVNYGFQRNMLGLKPIGIVISVAAIFTVFALASSKGIEMGGNPPAEYWITVGVSGLLFVIWVFVVTSDWVRDAADSYARALLASCDQQTAKSSNKKSQA